MREDMCYHPFVHTARPPYFTDQNPAFELIATEIRVGRHIYFMIKN